MTRPTLPDYASLPTIELEYKGPLDWSFMLAFYQRRAIEHIEVIDENYYCRHALLNDQPIWFRLTQNQPWPRFLAIQHLKSSER